MFTNNRRQEERTGKSGTPRLQYLQELVSQFQNATSEESKEKVVANLANFAYDPYNYTFLRQLNVLELFLDCISEPNEKLVEFGVGGICNSCADPANAAIVTQCGGIPLIIQCLSSPVRNTVNHALGALYFLCNAFNKDEILLPEVIDVIERFTFVIAFLLLLTSAALNDEHGEESMYFGNYYCYVVKPGVFAGGSVLSLASVVLGLIYYFTLTSAKNTNPWGNSSLPNQGGIAMGQPQFPPQNTQEPVFVHEDTYIRRQVT